MADYGVPPNPPDVSTILLMTPSAHPATLQNRLQRALAEMGVGLVVLA